ncbi:MAG: YwaF family protein [Lachnospiraceae bacterium]|nr:YwaF family protein [Lachnospiraceae bacterium]
MFFTYETKLPADTGYQLFRTEHIVIMTLCFLFICACIHFYKKSSSRSGSRPDIIFGSFPLILIIARMIYVICCKEDLVYELPLHLCSLAGIVCFFHAMLSLKKDPSWFLRSLKGFLGQVLFALCMPGAALAIIFPNGIVYPVFHFITFESYLFHTLIIIYVCFGLIDHRIVPSLHDAYMSILFLLVTVPFIYIFNVRFGTDYMFLLYPSYGSPLTGIYEAYGHAGYLVFYGILAVLEIFLINLIGSFINKRK